MDSIQQGPDTTENAIGCSLVNCGVLNEIGVDSDAYHHEVDDILVCLLKVIRRNGMSLIVIAGSMGNCYPERVWTSFDIKSRYTILKQVYIQRININQDQ